MSTTKINRNAPCLCGSGKKYKKCCGLKEAVSITAIVENEVRQLQGEIINYANNYFEIEIDEDFDLMEEQLHLHEEEEYEFFLFVHTVWFILFKPLDNGETILQRFIQERARSIQRPKVKEVLLSWTSPMPIAGRISSIESEQMVIHDTLRDKEIKVKLMDEMIEPDAVFGFGITVPFGEELIFFPIVFDLMGRDATHMEQNLQNQFIDSQYEDAEEFLKNNFIYLMNDLQFAIEEVDVDSFEWADPSHQEVAQTFYNNIQKEEYSEILRSTGIILWKEFCETNPRIKKPDVYAAALEYLVLSLRTIYRITKKEVAEKYAVSASTMGKILNKMEEVLEDKLISIKEAIQDDYLEHITSHMEESLFEFLEHVDDEDVEDLIDEEDLPF